MSDKSKQYESELLKVIEEKNIAFFDHCFAFVSFSRATAYNHGLEKLDTIKDAIGNNRVASKNYMLNEWIKSSNPTLQISAMRLLSTKEEHMLLNQSYVDHTTKGEGLPKPVWNIVDAEK